jgi:phosphonate metabolism protein PhnN/1,5-bisphosphokinase (PRPP-forming)
MTGRIFAVVGPSGVGKDTLIAGAVAADPGLYWARRVITRPASAGGEPYEGVSEAEFAQRLAAGEFVLDWQAHGLSYGLPRSEVVARDRGQDVLFNGSRAALAASRDAFPGLVVVRITAPADMLADRLAARARESRADIEGRLARASYDAGCDVPIIDVQNDATAAEGIARLLTALQRDRG